MPAITIAITISPSSHRALREFHALGSSTRPAVKRIQQQASDTPHTSLMYQGIRSRWPWPPISLQSLKITNSAIRNSKLYARRSQEGPATIGIFREGTGGSP